MEVLMKILETIEAYNKSDLDNVNLHDKLIAILSKFEGKKITKHIETEVKKLFKDAYINTVANSLVYLCLGYGDDKPRFLLGHISWSNKSMPLYTEKVFRDNNAWAGRAALERVAQNNEWAKENAAKVQDILINIKSQLQELEKCKFDSYPCPAYYEILRAFELSNLHKLKYD